VTVKVVKKVQKHKGRGTKRTVMKTVQNDSFLNFFAPPHGELGTIILIIILMRHKVITFRLVAAVVIEKNSEG